MAEPRTFQPDPSGLLNPEDYHYYRGQKWRVNDTYNLGVAQNAHEQKTTRNELARSLSEMTNQFAKMREGLAGNAAKGGLMNSGIWQKRLTDFGNDRNLAMANLRERGGDALAGLGLARDQLDHVLWNSTVDINTQEAARRAAVEAIRAGSGF